ncbi:unnamed protein product [Ilex paraguariensis]|uniref:Auxin-responsive protein n=1 Tax=Ilex paraguariensis TaxID=185542 RepID=A0ABC8RAB6_9AQUA
MLMVKTATAIQFSTGGCFDPTSRRLSDSGSFFIPGNNFRRSPDSSCVRMSDFLKNRVRDSAKDEQSSSVVGWPPIRSFRKNLASSSSLKPSPESEKEVSNKASNKKPINISRKGLFVKINMDGVPIGRKVDLKPMTDMKNSPLLLMKFFRGLLAAQSDSSADGMKNKQEGEKTITGLLVGRGKYTLAYEYNEGDRMPVGDVLWQ